MAETCKLVVFSGARSETRVLPIVGRDLSGLDSLAESADCIVLADCRGGDDLQRSDVALSVAEARAGRIAGSVEIIASMDSAAGLLALPTLGGRSARFSGLAWNREAFLADIGNGQDPQIAEHARMQILIAARAFGVPAYRHLEDDEATPLWLAGD